MVVVPGGHSSTSSNRAEHKVRSTNLAQDYDLHPADYGVDYVELSFMVRRITTAVDDDDVIWKPRGYDTTEVSLITSGWLEIDYKGHTIRIRLFRSDKGFRCYLHFNPSRIVQPLGIGLCRPRDLPAVIDDVMEVVSKYVRPYGPTAYFKVRRINIARNFYGVDSPIRYLTGLFKIRRPHAKYTRTWGGGDGKIGTLETGSKSGGKCKLYDKHLQSPHLAVPGTMRFEVEAHESWLKRLSGINTVSDLTVSAISKLMWNRMRWFSLETPVMNVKTAEERILRNQDLGTALQNGLLRYILERQFGLAISAKYQTVAKYGRILQELGIAVYADDVVEEQTCRLDFKTGTEVRVA